MKLSSIHHDGSGRYVRLNHPGSPSPGDEAVIRLRSGFDRQVERVFLRHCPDGEQEFLEMRRDGDARVCHWWQTSLRLSMPVTGYRFLLLAADGVWWYNGTGLHRYSPGDVHDFRILTRGDTPSWVSDAIFYQIFPDRFDVGEAGSNVREGEFTYWGTPSRTRNWGESPLLGGKESMVEFFGGDLAGIARRLPYIQDLGPNALYLNPIFTAFTNHRYDVADYFSVDPHLGGSGALARLRQLTRERSLRFILDVVPNHCGVQHPWFRSAQENSSSPTADYFTFHRHPDQYASWLGVRDLPKLNYGNGELRRIMYEGEQAVFRHWLRPPFASDGWRIDVANMLGRDGRHQLGDEVARGIRRAVKEENPDAYLLAEHYFDATPELQGDCWDGVMNYSGFTIPFWHWLGRFQLHQHGQPQWIASDVRWSTEALIGTWEQHRSTIPWRFALQQFNLLDSHDTPRIASIVNGDQALVQLALGVLLTYVGTPSIFYGDEIGLTGESDLAARRCMIWEEELWNTGLREFCRRMIALRKSSRALRSGGFQVLLVEDDCFAYLRDAENEFVVVVAYRGPGVRHAGNLPVMHGAIPDGLALRDVVSGASATVENGFLPLPAMVPGIAIWRQVHV